MPEVLIQFDPRQIQAIEGRLAGLKDGVPKALAGAINDTGTQERTQISKGIRQKFNIKKKDLDPLISVSPKATPKDLRGGVHLQKSKRPGLQVFGAKQIASGVSYKIEVGGARKTIPGAFMGPRPGVLATKLHGGVFIRKGKSRLPIVKLKGISPWAAFLKSGMLAPTTKDTEQRLMKNVEARTKFLILKANGEI